MLQDPGRGSKAGPQLQAVSLLLHLRLLSAYLAMPEPLAFAAEHETLSKLCAKALREGSLSGMLPYTLASAHGAASQAFLHGCTEPVGCLNALQSLMCISSAENDMPWPRVCAGLATHSPGTPTATTTHRNQPR